MTCSKFNRNHPAPFWQRRKIVTRFAQGSIGFFLVLLTACSNLPSSITALPASIRWPDVLNLPIISQIQPPASSETPSVSPEQLKLGMLLSLSGNLARFGNSMQDTTQLLVETVNGCGGVLKQSVQLFSADDGSNAVAGKAGITSLVETYQVGAVIGAIGSEVSNATVDIAVKNQVVQISPASASPVLTERAKSGTFGGFWFRTMPPDSFQGEALAKVAQQKGFKTVSILALDNDYGNSVVKAFETSFKQQGGKISTSSRFSPFAGLSNIDFVTTFGENPDAVLLVAEPDLGGAILRVAYELGFFSGNTKILLPVSMKTDSLADQVGQSIDGRYIASNVLGITPRIGSPALTPFQEAYKKRFNRNPGLYDANTWDAAAVAILAAEAAKSSTGAAIKTEIPTIANAPGVKVSDMCQALTFVREGKDIDYEGLSGTVEFNATGDSIASYSIWTIDYTGKIKIESDVQAGEVKPNG
ncbi:MAG: ABC transporter substrate-binding protein [Cyanobacteria bacterium RM1_2_2]|nr:ABC transporter substrate-binding protein [Cyanobacteria bacterium RM1_2_2]